MTLSDQDASAGAGQYRRATAAGFTPADWYQSILVVATVLLFETGFVEYLVGGRHVEFPPLAWLVVVGILALPIASWRGRIASTVDTRLLPWCAIYFAWTCISYVWSSHTLAVAKELRLRTLVCCALPLFALVFSSPVAVRVARRAIVGSVLLSIVLNAYDFLHPLTFSNVFGRSAGMYMNPNISATALVGGMVTGLMAVPRRWRALFVTLVGAGVLLTLSRGLLLCYAVAIIYFLATGGLRFRQLALAVAGGATALAAVLLLTFGLEKIEGAARIIVQSNVIERITDPSVAIGGADESTNERRAAAALGWQVFKEHPLIGGGVGSTVDWDMQVSTHNIYIRQLAEYGIFGIVLYPALLFLLVRGVEGEARAPLRAFVIALALAGLFSHNVLDEWDVLLPIALASVIAADARRHTLPTRAS